MGIKGLMQLIKSVAPAAVREREIKHYFGRTVAIDASMCLYQFLIAVRQAGMGGGVLQNDSGETTSHLSGMFYRTIKMLENGVKPVYVFDGKPPSMKGGELAKRKEAREKAEAQLETAKDAEVQDQKTVESLERRLVHVSKEQANEAKELLRLMGCPVVNAPCEAEAQCAILTKAGKVFATSTEDMDSLTFGTPTQLRYMMSSAQKKQPILEISLEIVLRDLELTMEQFIDLCVMCGCDYTSTIKGIGPKTALKMIKEHKTIEVVLKNLKEKNTVPEDFQFAEARNLFVNPDVAPAESFDLTFSAPNEVGILNYMVRDKGFDEARIRTGLARLKKAKSKSSQNRLESFFSIKAKPPPKKVAEPKKKGKVMGGKRKTPTNAHKQNSSSSATKKKKVTKRPPKPSLNPTIM